ncbi:hypothetical protein LCGC14_0491510 [marine sediment metagenome]|uniref:Uncharacterized protein n=1 Tax=marine sediment metagenome TaxID=412755 RepID=A0A0F9VF91_9ZZZZ
MLLKPMQMGADDNQDMVVIRLGDLRPMIPYQKAFEFAHELRLGCKQAARFDRAPQTFWREIDLESLEDCPKAHRGFRRSKLVPNVDSCHVRFKGALVSLIFDERYVQTGYEEGIKLHHSIRRAGRRAKAWAGDTSRQRGLLANLTDAEEDYRLGLA